MPILNRFLKIMIHSTMLMSKVSHNQVYIDRKPSMRYWQPIT